MIKNSDAGTPARRRAATPTIWVVLNRSRRTFDAQLSKSNDVKLQCLKRHVAGVYDDQQKFYYDYQKLMDKLIDSRRFCDDANRLGHNEDVLASHIVFLGSATVNEVLKKGIEGSRINEDLDLYKEAFLPSDAQAFAQA